MNTSSKFVVSVHILTLLAGRRFIFGEYEGMNSEEIARSVGTNAVVIRRLLGLMKAENLVASKAGSAGGFHLNKDPQNIKLSQIYDVVEEGNLFHMHYSPPNKICPVGSHIQEDLSAILIKAEDSFKMVLKSKSLFDMISSIMNKVDGIEGKTREEIAIIWNTTLEEMKLECELVT